MLEHIVASHTTHEDVGKVARDAGVKTLVLTHLLPSEKKHPKSGKKKVS